MRSRMLTVLALAGSLGLLGCDNNQKTTSAEGQPPKDKVVATIPPAPEPSVTPAPAPTPAALPDTTIKDTTVTVTPAKADVPKSYVVQKGDSLISIARKFYNDPRKYKDIAAANNISDPNKIKVGQSLTLP